MIPLSDFLSEISFIDALKYEYIPLFSDMNKFKGIEEKVKRLGEMSPWEIEKEFWQIIAFAIWGSIFLGDKEKVLGLHSEI